MRAPYPLRRLRYRVSRRGSGRVAVETLKRKIRADRSGRPEVPPEKRLWRPLGIPRSSADAIEPEVMTAAQAFQETPRRETRIAALEVLYLLPDTRGSADRAAFISRGEDGVVWCMVVLKPGDRHYFETYRDGEEQRNPLGQRCVRRGWGLAVSDVKMGTAPGTYQPLS